MKRASGLGTRRPWKAVPEAKNWGKGNTFLRRGTRQKIGGRARESVRVPGVVLLAVVPKARYYELRNLESLGFCSTGSFCPLSLLSSIPHQIRPPHTVMLVSPSRPCEIPRPPPFFFKRSAIGGPRPERLAPGRHEKAQICDSRPSPHSTPVTWLAWRDEGDWWGKLERCLLVQRCKVRFELGYPLCVCATCTRVAGPVA